MRLRFKMLRYALGFFAPLLARKGQAAYFTALNQLNDEPGLMMDGRKASPVNRYATGTDWKSGQPPWLATPIGTRKAKIKAGFHRPFTPHIVAAYDISRFNKASDYR